MLNLLTLISNIDMGNQMLAQNMGSEVTLYPCKTFDPTTGNDEWHFSTSPCDNELGGTCVSVCRTCGLQGDCESMKYHSHGTGNSSGDNSYRDGNTLPSPGGGVVGGGGNSSSNKSIFDTTLHIPTADELCIKYKEGYLPSSYKEQDCSFNCFTTCMEYCYNYFNNCLEDKTGFNREQFELAFLTHSRNTPICNRGFTLCQSQFLAYCGFDIQKVNFLDSNDFTKIKDALSANHPIMVSLQVSYDYILNAPIGHEVIVVSYHTIGRTYEAIDPGSGIIHDIDSNKIMEAYIINGYSSPKK